MDFGNIINNLLNQMAFFHLGAGNYVMIVVALVSEMITNNAVFLSPKVSSSISSVSMSSRSSRMSKGANLAPQEIRIDFAVLPVANCQGFVVPLLAFASCRITRFSLSFTV